MGSIQIDETFDTREGAEARMDRILRSYDPMGYGTRVKVIQDRDPETYLPTGKWSVKGRRYASCD